MPSAPVLTVAVAMYQSEDTIRELLESVVEQVGTDVEILIVDDASTDGSVKAARSVDSHGIPVRIVEHKKNQGLGPSRNTAVAEAAGDYIFFVDADDEVLPGALGAITSRLKSSDLDIAFIGTVENKRGRDAPLHDPAALTALATASAPWSIDTHPELLFLPPSTWSKVFRRDFLREEAIEFPPGYHQDLPSSTEALLRAKRVGAIDHLCYRYIRRGEGSSATRSKGTKTLVRVDQIKRIRERTDIPSLPRVVQEHLVAAVAMHLIWGNRAAYRTLPEEYHEELFIKSSEELSWWFDLAEPGGSVKSEPLMPTSEREFFSRALRAGDHLTWQKALRAFARKTRWQRRFSPSRYGLFKR